MTGAIAPASFSGSALLTSASAVAVAVSSGKSYGSLGELRVSLDTTGLTYVSGLPINQSGQLVVTSLALAGQTYYRRGMLFGASGALVTTTVELATSPLYEVNGLVFDSTGALVVTDMSLYLSFLTGTLDPRVSFSRGTNATQFDSQGRLVWAPHNLIPNSSMVGGSAPSTAPTNWTITNSANCTWSVVSAGTDFIEVRVRGTAGGATEFPNVQFGTAALAPSAANLESYTISATILRTATIAATGSNLNIVGRDSGLSSIAGQESSVAPTPGVSARYATNITFSSASVARAQGRYLVQVSAGQTVDETIKISFPQLERMGPNSPQAYVASVIGGPVFLPRFDYNPQTLAARGLLFEELRTNLNPTSLNAGNTGVTVSAGTSSTGATYLGWPSVRFTGDGLSASHFFYGGSLASPAASTVYIITAIVCSSSNDLIQLTASVNYSDANAYINFQFSTGTIVGSGVSATPLPVQNLGGGVYRIGFSFTSNAAPTGSGAAGILAIISSAADPRLPIIVSSAVIEGFGIQLEQSAQGTATTLIPTFGAAATRNGDVADLTPDIPYNAAGTTVYQAFERAAIPIGSVSQLNTFFFGDTLGQTYLSGQFGFSTAAQLRIDMVSGGVPQAQISQSLGSVGVVYKQAARFATNDARLAQNGALGTAATPPVTPPSSIPNGRKAIGRGNAASAAQINGWLRELRIYTQAFPDATLQALTS